MEYLAAYLILFTICLLTVARIIPYQIPLVLVLIYMLLRNRENISRVDYSLLATFIALFIFIGNLGRIPQFSSFLARTAVSVYLHVCSSDLKDKTLLGFSDRKELNMEYLATYLILFIICLLTVARIIPYQIPLVLVLYICF